MTIPGKPTSSKQKYRSTEAGASAIEKEKPSGEECGGLTAKGSPMPAARNEAPCRRAPRV
jgi:hypothetical protein